MRRIPELLAPAGTYEALLAAVAAGADAVYTGAGAFNARAGARDLGPGELSRGVAIAHEHGARVYVALNIYLRDDELDGALDLARSVTALGVDAVIVADAGLAAALSREEPGIEVHLSTQAGVHAPAGALLAAERLGASRVTCGRELSVEEIAAMAATGVEIEAFCHGAICISYAGACGFSAIRRGRSANRGDCTQPCRRHYGLVDAAGARVDAREGDMLLCPRDYLSVRHLGALVEAGVGAFKIEGRMKNPDYVYNVVRCYREALDAIAAGREPDVSALEARLARSFNRGFSVEYLEGRSGSDLMSWERSCNQGLEVGCVVERRHEEVVIELAAPVRAGDTLEIRFIPGDDAPADVPKRWPMVPCPVDAAAGEAIAVRCKRNVGAGSVVHMVRSAAAVDEAAAAIAGLDPSAVSRAVPGRADSGRSHRAVLPAGERRAAPVSVPAAGRALAVEPALPRIAIADDPIEAARLLDGGPCIEVAVRSERLLEADAPSWEPLLPSLTVVLEEVSRFSDEARHRALCASARRVVCRNLTQVAYALDARAAFEVAAPITVCNSEAALALASLGARRAWVPDELDEHEVQALAEALGGRVPLAARASGEPELMVTEHCLLTAEGPCSGGCRDCPRRAAERWLVEADGARLPVRVDALGRTRVLDALPFSEADRAPALAASGVSALVLEG